MQTIAFAAPMLPGKTDTDREAVASCASRARKAEHEASRRRAGIARGVSVDPEHSERRRRGRGARSARHQTAVGTLATSEEPFDRWFRDVVRGVHGIDLAAGFEPPEQVLDFRR